MVLMRSFSLKPDSISGRKGTAVDGLALIDDAHERVF
jgi:hypothetical protein